MFWICKPPNKVIFAIFVNRGKPKPMELPLVSNTILSTNKQQSIYERDI